MGARKDRHARIGEGYLGAETIINVINHPKLKGLPCILETPNELDGYAKEIQMLKSSHIACQK
jgi:deoxyribonuclease-4